MTDMTVVVKEAVAAQTAELVKQLGEKNDVVKRSIEEIQALAKAADDKAADARKELATYGTRFGDTDAKLKEIADKIATDHAEMQKAVQAIERMQEELSRPRGGSDDDKAVQELCKSFGEFAKIKHYGEVDKPGDFDGKAVTEEKAKAYQAALGVFWNKAMRLPNRFQHIEQGMTRDEIAAIEPLVMTKTISSITHGNRFWLSNEMYGQVIACYDEVTDLSRLFSQVSISRGAIEVMKDNDVEKRALFRCELDCAPGRNNTPALPGSIVIPTHELYDSETITHTMIEDSEVDLEGWLVPRVAEGFTRGRNEKFMNGKGGQEEPEGLLRPGNHIELASASINGSAPGQFTWQHLRIMPFHLPKKFQAAGSYMFSRDALMSMFTMADAQNRPLIDGAVTVDANGVMRLWGYPLVQVDQMSNYLDEDSAPVVNSKPIGFGAWASAYLVVDRKGFFVLRDPSYNVCGVTWHFGQRVGGGVLCPNASVFLKIT